MLGIMSEIFVVGVLLNLAYEILHSSLYKTCRNTSLRKYLYLMAKACVFDGLVIAIIYYLSYLIFNNINILQNYAQLAVFSAISFAFAYFWEVRSLKREKWEYAKQMPLVLGVGITPLMQLSLTGILSFYIIF